MTTSLRLKFTLGLILTTGEYKLDEETGEGANLGVEDCVFRACATVFGLEENPEDAPPPVKSELERGER